MKIAAAMVLCFLAAAAAGAERPNVVLILADDLGYGDVGFNGRTEWATPNLDALAKQGTIFHRWYCAGVVCAPSRAALLTGRYGIHNQVVANNDDLPAEEVTIAEALKPLGYATGLFGKWHHGKARSGDAYVHPMDQGFDEFFGFTGAKEAWQKFPKKLFVGREEKPSEGYADTLFTDHAIDFLKRKKDQPFFLYLPYTASHGIVEAPQEDVEQFKGKFKEVDPAKPVNATYAAMVTRLDKEVGRVLATLDELKLSEKTLVIFTSDHGATFEKLAEGATNYFDSNRPFRGQKRTLWEGGIRVPAVVRWPGKVAAEKESQEIVHDIDVMPTILAAAGAKPQAAGAMDGVDVSDVWRGGKGSERTLFWEWRSEGTQQLAAMRGNMKLVITGGDHSELFDVVADPAERRDIDAVHPAVATRLEKELKDWLATEKGKK
jgi:arylsulfatase A-like enzyme